MSVSRNMGSDGVTAFVPSSFAVKKMELTRFDGTEPRDIQNLVTDFEIIESIFSPTLVAKFSIKDTVNLMEEFPIIGHERFHLVLERKEGTLGREKRIELKFIITEYPLYGRSPNNPNVHAYKFSAISEHSYLSTLTRISRKFGKDKTIDEIKNIFSKDLKFSGEFVEGGEIISKSKGVLPNMQPLRAIEFFRVRACDLEESPLMVYQTLDGKIHLKTLHNLFQQEIYGEYEYHIFFQTTPGTDQDYEERSRRILSCASDLKFGRVFQSQRGAFASNLDYVDLSTKSYGEKIYSYSIKHNSKKGEYKPFSQKFMVDNKSLDSHSNAFSSKVSLNTKAYGESEKNSNQTRFLYEQKMRSYMESLETMQHDLRLYGDYELNPGKLIKLDFARAIDPQAMEDNSNEEIGNDELLSGNYLVTAVNHSFKGGEYFCNVRVKKNNLGFEI